MNDVTPTRPVTPLMTWIVILSIITAILTVMASIGWTYSQEWAIVRQIEADGGFVSKVPSDWVPYEFPMPVFDRVSHVGLIGTAVNDLNLNRLSELKWWMLPEPT